MTYYFMFSQGSYSDYMVGGLYACDHEVTESDWEDHCADYDKRHKEKSFEIYGTEDRWNPFDKEKSAAMNQWREENIPEETFIAKHGMTKIEYTEMWRG